MIVTVYGDLFYSPARVLVNPVNTVGTMSSGISYDFKRFYPEMFATYQMMCEEDDFDIGDLYIHRTAHKWVVNLPTKKHFRANSRRDYIEQGLQRFATICLEQNFASASFPALGGGTDDLDWEQDIRPMMEAYLEPLPIPIYMHIYNEDIPFYSSQRNIRAIRSWLTQQPRIVPFRTFWRELNKVCKQRDFTTFDDNTRFRVTTVERKGRVSLKITPTNIAPIFISESQLQDLWHYVFRAGYVMPYNLPNGLGVYASYLIAILAETRWGQPIQLARINQTPVIGLHIVPPSIPIQKIIRIPTNALKEGEA